MPAFGQRESRLKLARQRDRNTYEGANEMTKWQDGQQWADAVAAGGSLQARAEMDKAYQWRLEDMFANQAEWDAMADEMMQLAQKLSTYEGRLGESPRVLFEVLQLQDETSQRASRLFSYARMRRDEDNANTTYQALTDKAMTLVIQLQGMEAFITPELLSLPEATVRGWMEADKDLQLYRFAIEEVLREKPHVLSTKEEQLLAAAGEVTGAAGQIYTMFNNADTTFPNIHDETGREVELTHGNYIQFLESANRDVRKEAFEAVYGTYEKHRNTLAAIFSANVKKDVFYAHVRNYESARVAALDSDNVPISVYDNLIDAVHESLPAMHKYLQLRKRLLGLDELTMYDLYTPMVPDVDMKVPYDEAVETVQEAVKVLGDEYHSIAVNGLSAGWVDVYESKGKTSGAYSWGAYGVHPYILLNYHDTIDNMFTLAHELGHAMHTFYSHRHQPHVYSGYTIFVAEVASTCNEALLMDYLLKHTEDRLKRASLINHHLETIRGTVFRQTMFAEFEKLTHAHVEAGGALTPEWLCETYYALNQTYYGAVVNVNKEIELEWARIPHFYSAFYVYKYATGLSAATALAQKMLSEGEPAVHDYIRFLSSGGSNHPIELLRQAGVDMESPQPVRDTLHLFGQLVDELEALLDA